MINNDYADFVVSLFKQEDLYPALKIKFAKKLAAQHSQIAYSLINTGKLHPKDDTLHGGSLIAMLLDIKRENNLRHLDPLVLRSWIPHMDISFQRSFNSQTKHLKKKPVFTDFINVLRGGEPKCISLFPENKN